MRITGWSTMRGAVGLNLMHVLNHSELQFLNPGKKDNKTSI